MQITRFSSVADKLEKLILLNGFENHWLLLKNILKCSTHTRIFLLYRVSYFNLNRTKYSMLQEFDVNLDLTEIFSLMKNPACSTDLSPIEYIQEYKYYWISKTFSIWWV